MANEVQFKANMTSECAQTRKPGSGFIGFGLATELRYFTVTLSRMLQLWNGNTRAHTRQPICRQNCRFN